MLPFQVEQDVGADGVIRSDSDVIIFDAGCRPFNHDLLQVPVTRSHEGNRVVSGTGIKEYNCLCLSVLGTFHKLPETISA